MTAPAARRPRSRAGRVTSVSDRSVQNGWTMKPSATSPATSVISGPTPPSHIGGGRWGCGPGSKNGVMSVWV